MVEKRKGRLLTGPLVAVVAFAALLGLTTWFIAVSYLGRVNSEKLTGAQRATDGLSKTLGFALRSTSDTLSYFVAENSPSFTIVRGEATSPRPIFEHSGKFTLASHPGTEYDYVVASPYPIPAAFSGAPIEDIFTRAIAPFPGLVSMSVISVSGLEWAVSEAGLTKAAGDIPGAYPLSYRNSNIWIVESGRSNPCALFSIPWKVRRNDGNAEESGSVRITVRLSADINNVRKAVSLDNLTVFSPRTEFFFFSAESPAGASDMTSLRTAATGLPETGAKTVQVAGSTFIIGHFPNSDLIFACEVPVSSYWWLALLLAIGSFAAVLVLGVFLQRSLQAQIGGREERIYIEGWFEETSLVVTGMMEHYGLIPQHPASESLSDRAASLLHDFRGLLAKIDIMLQAESQKTREFSSLLEAADSSLVELGPDGKIASASNQFAHLLEVPSSWLIGRDFSSLVMGDPGKELFHREWEYLLQGSKVSFEAKLAVNDGEPVIAMVSAVPLNPRGGSCSAVLLLATDRRKFYLSRRSGHFRDRLLEMSRLAAEIAHNFNNALCAILGSVSLLEMRLRKTDPHLLEGPVGENINTIRRAADKSTQLARQLMRLTPKHEEATGESDLALVLGESVISMPPEWNASLASTQKIGIRVPISRYSLQSFVSESVRQIIARIPQGTKLLIRLGEAPRRRTPLGEVTFLGCGDSAAVFELYPQPSGEEGSGLEADESLAGGLHWLEAQRAIFDAGGAIIEDSDSLPTPNIVAYIPMLSKEHPPLHSGAHKSLSVLVVDDEETVGETIASYLRDTGESATVAGDSAALDKAVCTCKFDVVMLDLSFEKKGIGELLQQIRAFLPGALTVVMSGTPPTVGQKVSLEEFGVTAFLPKPIILADLGELINRIATEKHDDIPAD